MQRRGIFELRIWGSGGRISESLPARQQNQALGFPAACFWAEPIEERFDKVGTYEIYRVVSNLVNGLPPRYRDYGDVPPTSPRKR